MRHPTVTPLPYGHSGKKPPWWVDPLAYRLAEAFETKYAPGFLISAIRLRHLTECVPTKLHASLEHLFAAGRDGEFFRPAREIADTFWERPYQIIGPPADTLEKSQVVRVGVLADLSAAQLRQVNAVAHMFVAAVYAVDNPPRLDPHAPLGLNDAGDTVGVRKLAARRAAKRGLSYSRANSLRAASILVINHFRTVFGRPHYSIAATLLECLTGERLTPEELRTLVNY
jgi:hypothetical protein